MAQYGRHAISQHTDALSAALALTRSQTSQLDAAFTSQSDSCLISRWFCAAGNTARVLSLIFGPGMDLEGLMPVHSLQLTRSSKNIGSVAEISGNIATAGCRIIAASGARDFRRFRSSWEPDFWAAVFPDSLQRGIHHNVRSVAPTRPAPAIPHCSPCDEWRNIHCRHGSSPRDENSMARS